MPQQSSPPYTFGSVTIPRQLDRWLDINPQNGPLRRTQTYITLPVFSQPVSWKGYSEIVAAFNFEGPNSFSLLGANLVAAVNPNYTLCIMWIDSLGNVNRYSLWRAVGDVIYFKITPYVNQLIKKNFRLEVWSTPVTAAQISSVNFYTSVAGNVDYRYGVDSNLSINDPIVTNFQNVNSSVTPFDTAFPTINFHFDPNIGVVSGPPFGQVLTWTDTVVGQQAAISTGTVIQQVSGTPIASDEVYTNFGYMSCNLPGLQGINTLVFGIYMPAAGGEQNNIFSDGTEQLMIRYNGVNDSFEVYLGGVWGLTIPSQSNLYPYKVLVYQQKNGIRTLYMFDMTTGNLVQAESIAGNILSGGDLVFGSNASGSEIDYFDVGISSDATLNPLAFSQWFFQRYFSNMTTLISLPLTFPVNALPTAN